MSDQKLIIGYYRLSMEDDSEGESNSIINQRKLVKDYISNIPELVAMPFQEFYDDGYSGSSMERPAIKQVLELARENKVQCIVVKDFSRFARNYIEMGTYLEQIFPFLGVRFISISDRYDSKDYKGKSSDIEVQFKGLIADFYVKDQSVKVKSAVSTRREQGEYCCGSAPYGYRINPENKKELVIVEDEAEVIRRVFELTKSKSVKYDYIHGEIRKNSTFENCNLILGIDEYLEGEEKTKSNEFIQFKKFYQRIYKRTGCKYVDWIKTNEEWLKRYSKVKTSENYIYILGHSLDITDGDILSTLINMPHTRTTIFYHNQESLGNQISNLVKILGEDELISMVHGENAQIVFKEQQKEVAVK